MKDLTKGITMALKIVFSLFSILCLILIGCTFYAKEFLTMISLFLFLLISLFIIFSKELKNTFKKIKIKDTEVEFNTEGKKQFVNIADELLEKNFPKLTEIAQKEVEKRITTWIKDFLKHLEDNDISLKQSHLFYDPDFQFVLSKALELVGRKNDMLLNKALIKCLTSRIIYNDSKRDDLITQIDSVIVNDIPRLSENHFKLICLTKLLQDIKTILNINDFEDFKKIGLPCMKQFILHDVRCYTDLCNTVIVSNGGNKKLLSPNEGVYTNNAQGKISRPKPIINNLFDYFVNIYDFFSNITQDEYQELMQNETFKECDTLFTHVLKYIAIYPLGEHIVNDYGIEKINEILKAK